MSIKYFEPLISLNDIFINFIGDFWFFSVNQSDSVISRKLTQLTIALNNQRLWPLKIDYLTQNFVESYIHQNFEDFVGVANLLSHKNLPTNKKDLFLFFTKSFSFTLPCLIHLLYSFAFSFSIRTCLQILQKTIKLITNYKLLEKRQIKGTSILMIYRQFFQNVGFYGFY